MTVWSVWAILEDCAETGNLGLGHTVQRPVSANTWYDLDVWGYITLYRTGGMCDVISFRSYL